MIRKLNKVLFIIIIFFMACNIVKATPGGLRNSSIKTCPDGITYGLHSDGNGGTHWHQAAKNPKGQYYPTGETTYYEDPCPESNKNEGTAQNTKPSNSTNAYNNSNNNNVSSNTNTTETKKSNDATIKYIRINGDSINVSDNMKYTSKKKSVNISIVTNNSKAKYEIVGNIGDLSVDELNTITIKVTAEDETTKDYIVEITREVQKSYVRITNLKLNDTSVNFDFNNKKEISVFNEENKLNLEYQLSNNKATLVIKKNNQVVENGDQLKVGKNNYELVVIDEDGNENKYELIIERMSKFESIVAYTIGIIIFAIIILVIIKIIKKKK